MRRSDAIRLAGHRLLCCDEKSAGTVLAIHTARRNVSVRSDIIRVPNSAMSNSRFSRASLSFESLYSSGFRVVQDSFGRPPASRRLTARSQRRDSVRPTLVELRISADPQKNRFFQRAAACAVPRRNVTNPAFKSCFNRCKSPIFSYLSPVHPSGGCVDHVPPLLKERGPNES
jgi:hypothetical protein